MPLPLGGGTVDDGLQDGPDHPDYADWDAEAPKSIDITLPDQFVPSCRLVDHARSVVRGRLGHDLPDVDQLMQRLPPGPGSEET